jgi:Na+/proline symporter
MSPLLILACIGAYFACLLLIAWFTSRGAGNDSYFLGNKASPWYAVAFGLIGDSLSGVTFISVPGTVATSQFSYLQVVLGYVVGYFVISEVLLPVFYRMNLTSIYTVLGRRLGPMAQRTGSAFFLLSRLLGAAARLYLAVGVIQLFVFDRWHVPFAVTVSLIIILILAYTYKGGIKTLVWTDTFQSTFLLLGVGLSVVFISRQLDLGPAEMIRRIGESDMSQTFFWDWKAANFFPKQFLGGAFIAICMTGLDQNMMQKNLSCRTLGDAQKNIRWFGIVVVGVNLMFLGLGVLLFQYAQAKGIAVPDQTDHLFPTLALQHLGAAAGIVFILGLTAATFSSADSVLTTLTTSFCIDILGWERDTAMTEARKTRLRHIFHVIFAVLLLLTILVMEAVADRAVIGIILKVAAYTYGPLLGLFAYALMRGLRARKSGANSALTELHPVLTPVACLVAPAICWILDQNSRAWFGGYGFGNELLVVNGFITFVALCLIPKTPAKRV